MTSRWSDWMRSWVTLSTLLLAVQAHAARPQAAPSGRRHEQFELESRVFSNTRTIRVVLPKGYDDSGSRRYPVLYLNDGFAVFHGWDVEGAVARLETESGARIIVVGIDNAASIPGGTSADRAREYLPWVDDSDEPPLVEVWGGRYPDFLVEEVLPAVESRYRASAKPRERGLGGASYGGLAALYAAIHSPGVFGRLLLESVPLYVGDFRIVEEASRFDSGIARVWIAVGGRETGDPEIDARVPDDARRLREAIRAAAPDAEVRVVVDPEGRHETASWGRRLPEALKFLYHPESTGATGR
jgi:predicted alpha/beta superfamily hydrolase